MPKKENETMVSVIIDNDLVIWIDSEASKCNLSRQAFIRMLLESLRNQSATFERFDVRNFRLVFDIVLKNWIENPPVDIHKQLVNELKLSVQKELVSRYTTLIKQAVSSDDL